MMKGEKQPNMDKNLQTGNKKFEQKEVEVKKDNSFLVDREDRENKYVNSSSGWENFGNNDDSFFKIMRENFENLKPSFKDFFTQVISEQPDYIILLDKGARSFGVPFHKYLKDLHLEKKPDVLFFNDNSYKQVFYNQDFTNPKEVEERLKKDFIDSHPEKDFANKKLFIVDETIHQGTGAKLLLNFFDLNNVDGHYFAFGSDGESDDLEEKFGNDKRVTIYHGSMLGDVQKISRDNFSDFKNPDTGIIETKKRFERVEELDVVPDPLVQEALEKKKKIVSDARKKVGDLIYKALSEIDWVK